MIDNSSLSYQIPAVWQAKIERLATERNKSPEAIVDEAIALYLGESPEDSNSRLNLLEQEVATLRSTLTVLIATVKGLQQRSLSKLPTSNFLRTDSTPQSLNSQQAQFFDEETEDEPDEILYGFLQPEPYGH